MTIAAANELMDRASLAVGPPRLRLLAAAGEILKRLPSTDIEVDTAIHRRTMLVLRRTDHRKTGQE
jgi:hypothetical protein